jgi:hypothetical protein
VLRALTICSIIAISVSAYGQASLKPAYPDEPGDYTFDKRFSVARSLESLAAIRSALESFKKLTEAAGGKIPKERLAEIGNTGWDMQNLGFANHVEAVKGTLLKQDYLITKVAFELAQRKAKTGEIDQRALLETKSEYEKAEKQFQEFWEGFSIAD